MGDLLGVPSAGMVYGRSATQLIYDFSRALAKQWRPGDEVVVTRLDHDANIRPWIHAAGRAADRAERPWQRESTARAPHPNIGDPGAPIDPADQLSRFALNDHRWGASGDLG